MDEEQVATIDLDAVRRFASHAVHGLGAAREEIDALNVYPVPDGDTGTNMFLTVEAARDAMAEAEAAHPGDLRAAMAAYSRGALLGARGNSGVILSQLVGALFRRIGPGRPRGPLGRGVRRRHGAGHRGGVPGGRRAGRGHHPQRRPGRLRGRRGGREGPRRCASAR